MVWNVSKTDGGDYQRGKLGTNDRWTSLGPTRAQNSTTKSIRWTIMLESLWNFNFIRITRASTKPLRFWLDQVRHQEQANTNWKIMMWIRTVTNRIFTLLNAKNADLRANLIRIWIIFIHLSINFFVFFLYLLVLIHFWVNINQPRWPLPQSQYKLTRHATFYLVACHFGNFGRATSKFFDIFWRQLNIVYDS